MDSIRTRRLGGNHMVNVSRFTGCMIGGAIGDALGYPIKFMNYDQIIASYGVNGLNQPLLNENMLAEISDDTQMSLFTAEGLIWAKITKKKMGYSDIASRCFYSYERWLHTQDYQLADENYYWILQDDRLELHSPLLKTKELFKRRTPETTCLQVLMNAKNQDFGRVYQPVNQSKGSGGIMRIAPVGLAFYKNPKVAFKAGCEVAAITHTHPTGYYAAGALSAMIAYILNDKTIKEAAEESSILLSQCPGSEETKDTIESVLERDYSKLPSREEIKLLGDGVTAAEVLAVGLYAALCYEEDFCRGICLAGNHSGNSDTTGSICGNLIGAKLGIDGIKDEWINSLECKNLLIEMAYQLFQSYK